MSESVGNDGYVMSVLLEEAIKKELQLNSAHLGPELVTAVMDQNSQLYAKFMEVQDALSSLLNNYHNNLQQIVEGVGSLKQKCQEDEISVEQALEGISEQVRDFAQEASQFYTEMGSIYRKLRNDLSNAPGEEQLLPEHLPSETETKCVQPNDTPAVRKKRPEPGKKAPAKETGRVAPIKTAPKQRADKKPAQVQKTNNKPIRKMDKPEEKQEAVEKVENITTEKQPEITPVSKGPKPQKSLAQKKPTGKAKK